MCARVIEFVWRVCMHANECVCKCVFSNLVCVHVCFNEYMSVYDVCMHACMHVCHAMQCNACWFERRPAVMQALYAEAVNEWMSA